MMHWLLDPDDWFGCRPWACMLMIMFLSAVVLSI